jgi:hypothetical protein
VLPDTGARQEAHDRAMLAVLAEYGTGLPWWLGCLRTGADDLVWPAAPTVTLYAGWEYLLVEAGPRQAARWRQPDAGAFWKGVLPNLLFPADRSWLVSTLWGRRLDLRRRASRAHHRAAAAFRPAGQAGGSG